MVVAMMMKQYCQKMPKIKPIASSFLLVLLLLLLLHHHSDAFSIGSGSLSQRMLHRPHKRNRHWLTAAEAAAGEEADGIGVGIDLGTTNSAIAFLDEENTPRIIEIPNNGRTMKSVVAIVATDPDDAAAGNDNDDDNEEDRRNKEEEEAEETLVGTDAIQWEQNQKQSAYRHVKRIMGVGADYIPKEILNVVPHAVAVPAIQETNTNIDGHTKNKKNKNKKKKKNFQKKKKKKPTLQKILDNAKDNPTMLSSLSPESKNLIPPERVSASILEALIDAATQHTRRTITRAVIGVPAYFNDAQRDATVRAANVAGIEKVKLLREPEAAALAYGVDKEQQQQEEQQEQEREELVLVFDLGGGTYDVSVLLVEKGLTEVVCTSGDSQLGGSNFDAKIAKYLSSNLLNSGGVGGGVVGGGVGRCQSDDCSDAMVQAAEAIRIYLSNNRAVQLALPLDDEGWLSLDNPSNVILSSPLGAEFESGTQNATHLFHEMSRKDMEKVCLAELQLLLRPIREVAIMAGALLPGDARPSIVETSLEMEENSFSEMFYDESDALDPAAAAAIESARQEIDLKAAKKQQQKGRRKARQVAKKERKYREETKKVNDLNPVDTAVRGDGISGRPISRLVLVGGATRMPAIGRILTALTGCVPQKTIDPDEAVALGCAVHVGVLDGNEEMGTVLNPMQAAILRAVIEKESREGGGGLLDEGGFDDEDDFEFGDFEEIVF